MKLHPILEKYNEKNNFGALIGMQLHVLAPGEVQYRMTITDQHLSNPSAAHGGAVSALMDGILGVAALSRSVEDLQLVSTVEFKINYLQPVRLGDELLGTGKVIFCGKRLITSEGEIVRIGASRELIAKGIGTFNVYPVAKNPLFKQELDSTE